MYYNKQHSYNSCEKHNDYIIIYILTTLLYNKNNFIGDKFVKIILKLKPDV